MTPSRASPSVTSSPTSQVEPTLTCVTRAVRCRAPRCRQVLTASNVRTTTVTPVARTRSASMTAIPATHGTTPACRVWRTVRSVTWGSRVRMTCVPRGIVVVRPAPPKALPRSASSRRVPRAAETTARSAWGAWPCVFRAVTPTGIALIYRVTCAGVATTSRAAPSHACRRAWTTERVRMGSHVTASSSTNSSGSFRTTAPPDSCAPCPDQSLPEGRALLTVQVSGVRGGRASQRALMGVIPHSGS